MAGDDKWEDESLIVVELSGIIEQDWIQNIGNKCKIVGLDTGEPLLQIDRYVFSGQHKDTDGTDVIFEHSPGSGGDAGQTQLRYNCHTFKKLSMQRAFLTAKDGESSAAVAEASVEDCTTEHTQTAIDFAEDESHDVNTTSSMDTDTVLAGQNRTEITTEDANKQRHADDVMLVPGGAAEKDIAPPTISGEKVAMDDS